MHTSPTRNGFVKPNQLDMLKPEGSLSVQVAEKQLVCPTTVMRPVKRRVAGYKRWVEQRTESPFKMPR